MLPHAERTPWVPSNLCRGGTAVGETREEGGEVLILMYAPFTHVEEENFTEFVKFVKNEKTPSFFKNILSKIWQSITKY